MTKLPKIQPEEPKALSVEQLLRFKRAECPDPAFWQDFDRKLHQKLFKTVVERRNSPIKNWFSAFIRSRSTYAMPALAALMVAVGFALTRGDRAGSSPALPAGQGVDMVVSVEAPANRAVSRGSERFVMDGLNLNADNGQFRKVMATQAMKVSSSGSTRYTADQLGAASTRGEVLYSSTTF
jgi:hypothetical protein